MGKCSCAKFFENHICKHTLAVGYLYEQVDVDSEALEAIAIGKKAKRGRKAKVGSALIID